MKKSPVHSAIGPATRTKRIRLAKLTRTRNPPNANHDPNSLARLSTHFCVMGSTPRWHRPSRRGRGRAQGGSRRPSTRAHPAPGRSNNTGGDAVVRVSTQPRGIPALPGKARSGPDQGPLGARSGPAQDPLRARSGPAHGPLRARSRPAQDSLRARSRPAQYPLRARSGPAQDPLRGLLRPRSRRPGSGTSRARRRAS